MANPQIPTKKDSYVMSQLDLYRNALLYKAITPSEQMPTLVDAYKKGAEYAAQRHYEAKQYVEMVELAQKLSVADLEKNIANYEKKQREQRST